MKDFYIPPELQMITLSAENVIGASEEIPMDPGTNHGEWA